jgi:hypothetical protein
MILGVDDRRPADRGTDHDVKPTPRPDAPPADAAAVDEMGKGSFPASDPPAVWTWEVEAPGPAPPADS